MDQLSAEKFTAWLDAYGRAWETGDAAAVLELFERDARYEETPFDPPMIGHEAIRRYWEEGAGQAQRDIRFSFGIIAVQGDRGTAHWQASFVRVPSGIHVALDGVLMAEFGGGGSCRRFREWWHRKETTG